MFVYVNFQVIYASDVSVGQPISTFGWSLSGGMDMDDNLYPDLLVGAYLSDAAVLLKWVMLFFTFIFSHTAVHVLVTLLISVHAITYSCAKILVYYTV